MPISIYADVSNNIGFLAAGLSVAYCGASLASISHVMRTKSADTLPFYLILMTTIVTGLWTLYGSILEDSFIKIPNTLGFLIALAQLSLFFYFPVNTKPTKSFDELPLILVEKPDDTDLKDAVKPN